MATSRLSQRIRLLNNHWGFRLMLGMTLSVLPLLPTAGLASSQPRASTAERLSAQAEIARLPEPIEDSATPDRRPARTRVSGDEPPRTGGLSAAASEQFASDLPPNTRGRSGGTRGRRTGVASLDGRLLLLTSAQNLEQTTSRRPTFAWFVRDSRACPMEFRLYQVSPDGQTFSLVKEVQDDNFRSAPGINVLSLSLSTPELLPGQKYVWQVELICDANSVNDSLDNTLAEAEIEVVEMQPDLRVRLSSTPDRVSRANLLADSNLWYDALSIVLTAGQEPRLSDLKQSLLRQVAVGDAQRGALHSSPIRQIQR